MNGYNLLKHFNNSTSDEVARDTYDLWADEYDEETASKGYVAHETSARSFDEELKIQFGEERFKLRILDVGAGTGFVGKTLKDLGYTNVDGLDISQKMLDIAREKGLYNKLICAGVSDQIIDEINDGQYDASVSSGTITAGHVKPCGLKEILRHVKQGGLICFTLRQDVYENESYGYSGFIEKLIEENKWLQVGKQLITYHSNAPRPEQNYCYLFTYKVL